jgi:hypothetical protein
MFLDALAPRGAGVGGSAGRARDESGGTCKTELEKESFAMYFISPFFLELSARLLQLRVLPLGFLQDEVGAFRLG